jgi:AraC-like DNA-binding protein/quercetin dioxygenase-like cupin family protein
MKKIPIRQLSTTRQGLPSAERFTIRRVEDLAGSNDLFHDLHRHDFFFILAIHTGKGNHEIDFTRYNVHNNAVFFVRPGQVHQLELKAASTGYLVEFNTGFYYPKDKLANQRLRKASNKNYCRLEVKRFDKLQAILSAILEEYTVKEEGYQDVIKLNLDILFIEFVRQSINPVSKDSNDNSYTQERFEEYLELLNKHIAVHKQVAAYTDLMNLSAYQLNEITKTSIGKTASALINEQILLEAKRYLLATQNQVKEIADQLGYEDPSYFIRFFKKHSGHSPEAFRRNFK